MSAVFLKLLNLSITANWLILAVILVRFLLKKAPKWISCVLWALVAIRLVCPFSLESALSLVPSTETVNTTHFSARPYIQSGVDVIDNAANDYLGSHYFEGVTVAPQDSLSNPINVISIIWIIGMATMILYSLISYIRLKRNVSASVAVRDNILACDDVKSPFIIGIFKPLIYVPSSMNGATLDYVITHEMAHIKRHDHWWKPFGFLLLTGYWFNPLCWIAYVLLCRDIEMACDEKVIRDMDKGSVAEYSQALLDCSFPRRRIAACPLAFGEVGVKGRVKSVLNYKKPAFWIIVVAIAACLAVAVCFLTSPFSEKSLSGKLGVSMDMAVAEYNHSVHSDGNFIAADYDVLRISKGKGKTTVYAWVYYAEYSFDGADVKMESASHIPTVITFDTSADGSDSSSYDVVEYWIPGDGSDYAKDIRSKFPITLWAKAFDTSGAAKQEEKCLSSAQQYFGSQTAFHTFTENADGTFVADNGKTYQYKLELVGRSPNAVCDSCYVVLSNNKNLTFERVNESIFTSNTERFLDSDEAIIISISALNETPNKPYTYNVAYANWTDDSRIYTEALNGKMMTISSVRHLPVYKFDTKEELGAFKSTFKDTLTIDQGHDETPSFEYITAAYDDSFFSKYSLILSYVEASSGSYRFGVSDVYCDAKSFCMYIEQLNNPESYTADMAGWLIVVEVNKEDIADCTSFDAQLGKPLE